MSANFSDAYEQTTITSTKMFCGTRNYRTPPLPYSLPRSFVLELAALFLASRLPEAHPGSFDLKLAAPFEGWQLQIEASQERLAASF